VTPIYLEPNISKMLGDRDLVPMEHQQETPYGELNRHVINNVMYVVAPVCFGLNISQTDGDTDSVTMEHL